VILTLLRPLVTHRQPALLEHRRSSTVIHRRPPTL
jgi:hypothetical protein